MAPPPVDPLPDRRLDPDRQEEEQEERQLVRMIKRHPRVAIGLAIILALAFMALGSLFGRDLVVGVARAALTVSGVPLPPSSGTVSDARDAGAGRRPPADLRAIVKDELERQLQAQAVAQKEWTLGQLQALEGRMNSRIDGAITLARLARNSRSQDTAAAGVGAASPN